MFIFLPKPIYHFITDYRLGGPLVILLGLMVVWLFIQAVYLLRFLGKRIRLLHTMCIGKIYIFVANPFWFFGIHRDKVDFYLKNGENVLAIKIMGTFCPGMEFCFLDKIRFYKQRHIAVGSQLVMIACGYSKERMLPEIDFFYQAERFGIGREQIVPTLLFCPAPYKITACRQPMQRGERKNLVDYAARFGYGASYHTGDMLFGQMILDTATLRKLFRRLSDEGKPTASCKMR